MIQQCNNENGLLQNGKISNRSSKSGSRRKTTWFGKLSIWIMSAAVGLTFMILDDVQTGSIEYKEINQIYNTNNQTFSNSFKCGYNRIVLKCDSDGNICNRLDPDYYDPNIQQKIKFNRNDINPSYNETDAYIYFISTVIGCSIPWMLITLLFVLNMDQCRPGTDVEIIVCKKCFVLCLIAMLVSIVAVVFGIMLTVGTENCSDGLYQYIELKLGTNWQYYEWSDSEPDIKYGLTLIFVMVNCGLTCVFTMCCGVFTKCGCESVEGKQYRKLGHDEDKNAAAHVAKMSINPNEEGE